MPSSRAAAGPRYAPAIRLEELRAYLDASGGATVYEIAERLHVSVRTAIRYLRALEAAGDKLWDDYDGSKKIWRLLPTARSATLRLTTSQMVSLYLSRRIFDFLAGTGFEDDLEQLFRQLEVLLRKKDFVEVRHLDRKLWAINEAPYHYEGRIEDVNDILTALIREDRLSLRHGSVDRGRSKFEVNPYTLLVYKRACTCLASATTTAPCALLAWTASKRWTGSRDRSSATPPITTRPRWWRAPSA